MLLTTFEILLTIVTPLLALYLHGGWRPRTVAVCMVCVAVVWYLTYAPIHELSHAGATLLAGGRVLEVKLIPSFWEGTFAVAWVMTAGLDRPWQQLAMGGAPYAVDVACVTVGLAVVRPRLSGNALVVGLLFMLLSLRRGALVVPRSLTRARPGQRRGHPAALRWLPRIAPPADRCGVARVE